MTLRRDHLDSEEALMGTTTKQAVAVEGELRRIAVSRIRVLDGFNPRRERDPNRFAELVATVREEGVLEPVLVTPNQDGDYDLVAGEGRFLAAVEAGCTEVPATVRSVDPETGGLELAMIENLVREELSPVDEAYGYQRLIEAGLTRKGVAEKVRKPLARIRERLSILELPAELHRAIAHGTVPLGALKALVALAKIHPQLPVIAAARVGEQTNAWEEPLQWSEVTADPVGAVCAHYDGDPVELPAGVYEAGRTYAVAQFSLTEQANKDLAALCRSLEVDVDRATVHFGREAVEQATRLGAAHQSESGFQSLIVGNDVAAQLAADDIKAQLKAHRAQQRREREFERQRQPHDGEPAGAPDVVETEEQAAERRREERKRAQGEAVAFNDELGAAVVKSLSRLRVDERVVKVLAAVDLHGELDKIALRGPRYGFPGWVVHSETKTGKPKLEYLGSGEAQAKARTYLQGASTMAEYAGRCVAVCVMALYAREEAVANSNQAFYSLSVTTGWSGTSGLPWADEVVDLLDEIAVERLPAHLTERRRAELDQRRTERERQAREREEAKERLARFGDDVEAGLREHAATLSDADREQIEHDISTLHAPYSTQAWELRRAMIAAATEAEGDDITPPDAEQH
jgi:ParB/RepB/Spo0J family partition protein